MSRQEPTLFERLHHHLVGAAMLGVLVGLIALTAAFYNRSFSDTASVTVETSRSGLIMDPGNKVKYRGVEIGRVAAVDAVGAGKVEIELAVDRDHLSAIADNVGAELRASTIFGAKYVELVDAPRPSGQALAEGHRIRATNVTREINGIFDRLDTVLDEIDVVAVNDTLFALSGALEGRGDDIADRAVRADRYLTALEPQLPQLRRDLRALAGLSDLGVRLEPALIRILDNVVTPAGTVVDQAEALDRLLVDAALLGQTGAGVLGENTDRLVEALVRLRPTTGALAEYAAQLPCFLRGLERAGTFVKAGAGGTSPGLNIIASLRTQVRPFSPATDKPTLVAGRGPSCGPLPFLGPGDLPAPEVD